MTGKGASTSDFFASPWFHYRDLAASSVWVPPQRWVPWPGVVGGSPGRGVRDFPGRKKRWEPCPRSDPGSIGELRADGRVRRVGEGAAEAVSASRGSNPQDCRGACRSNRALPTVWPTNPELLGSKSSPQRTCINWSSSWLELAFSPPVRG